MENHSRKLIAVNALRPSLLFSDRVTSRWVLQLGLLLGMGGALLPHGLLAQSDNSYVVGTISDPSGALVAGAKVTITNEGTGLIHETISNRSGFYTVAGLPPGRYTVLVSASGFNALTSTGNNLDPSLPATINLSLQVGGGSE